MSRWPVLLVALTMFSCTDRSLENNGDDTSSSTDLAGIKPGVDQGGKLVDGGIITGSVDLAIDGTQVGVACGGSLCSTSQVCCAGSAGAKCSNVNGGMQMNPCGATDASYRCDGPEDCTMGRRCVGMGQPTPDGAPLSTSCRMNTMMGAIVICHDNSDCRNGDTCTPTMSSLPGAPALSICE